MKYMVNIENGLKYVLHCVLRILIKLYENFKK